MQAAIEARYPLGSCVYEELTELVLDGCKIKTISKEDGVFLSRFRNLTTLSCSRTGLSSIEHIPKMPTLKTLELLDNALSTSNSHLDILKDVTPSIRVLRLAGNRLKDVDELIQSLIPLKFLEVLDVEMNLFNRRKKEDEEVFTKIFQALPQLKVLDGRDRNGDEINEDDEDEEIEDDEEEEDDDEDEEASADGDGQDGASANDFLTDCRADLKAFYEKDYTKGDDDEDQDDYFNPLEDEEEEDDEEDDPDEKKEDDNESFEEEEEEEDDDDDDDDLQEEEEEEEEQETPAADRLLERPESSETPSGSSYNSSSKKQRI